MRVALRGLSVVTPSGWDARIYQRTPTTAGEITRPIMHAADFALPNVRGDYGSGAVEIMAPDKVFLSLIEFDAAEATTALFSNPRPTRITAGEFGPNQLQRGIPGQAGAQFFFSERGRAFCLYVVIGSYADRAALVARANQIFQGMEIS
jgi:hypothetical protein